MRLDIKITPSKLSGKLKLPPSKSIAHRHIICASLADGVSEISNIAYSQDILASIDAMKALGASFDMKEDTLKVCGIGSKVNWPRSHKEKLAVKDKSCEDLNINDKKEKIEINCKESGSTIRFLLPILTLFDKKFIIKAEGRLLKRPMDPYFEIFDREGVIYQENQESLSIEGGKKFRSDRFYIDGTVSSQFISGMMFLLPLLDHNSEIIIKNKLESKSYVDLTIDSLAKYNIEIENDSYRRFKIKGKQKYRHTDSYIEGDYSQAAFFVVANALGNEVDLTAISKDSLQGDRKILDIAREFGASVSFLDESQKKGDTTGGTGEVEIMIREGVRKAYSFDGSDIPDIVPVLSLLATLSSGKTTIKNISRLRIKESDRIESTSCELEKLGADIVSGEDYIEINGVNGLKGDVTLDSHKDHRIAMMLAIAASICDTSIIIRDADSVKKSFPDFWEKYRELGGIYEWNLG